MVNALIMDVIWGSDGKIYTVIKGYRRDSFLLGIGASLLHLYPLHTKRVVEQNKVIFQRRCII